jgi:hypothetical protein
MAGVFYSNIRETPTGSPPCCTAFVTIYTAWLKKSDVNPGSRLPAIYLKKTVYVYKRLFITAGFPNTNVISPPVPGGVLN